MFEGDDEFLAAIPALSVAYDFARRKEREAAKAAREAIRKTSRVLPFRRREG